MTVLTAATLGRVDVVTLDDGKANALSMGSLDALHRALDDAEQSGHAVVLAGREGRFCAGFDLPTLTSGTEAAGRLLRGGFELAARLLAFPLPVVAACTGHAYAMGAFLLLASDARIGARGAPHRITANEVAIGLTMPRAATVVCRRLSPPHYDRVVVQAEVLDTEAAVTAGFLDRTVPEADVVTAATTTAEHLMTLDRHAFAATKLRAHEALLTELTAAIDTDEAEFRVLLGLGRS